MCQIWHPLKGANHGRCSKSMSTWCKKCEHKTLGVIVWQNYTNSHQILLLFQRSFLLLLSLAVDNHSPKPHLPTNLISPRKSNFQNKQLLIITAAAETERIIIIQHMHFMRSSANLPLKWLIIIFFSNTLIPAFSDPRIEEAGLFCGTSKPPPNTTIVPTFVEEMEKISQLVSTNKWGLNIINHSAIPLFCLAQCFNDLSRTDCLSCYAASRTRLPRCLPALSGRLYLDGCFLRYDTYDFFDESVDPSHDRVNCSGGLRVEEGFRESAGVLIDKVSRLAILKGGFGVMEVEGVFGLAQCWRSLSKESCVECLEKAAKEVRGCLPSRQGRGLMAGCYFRYSDHKFYNQEGDAHRFTASGEIFVYSLHFIFIAPILSSVSFYLNHFFSLISQKEWTFYL